MYSIGDKISCTYRNRKVEGIIFMVSNEELVVKLEANYKGKNEEWFAGELKVLMIKLIK